MSASTVPSPRVLIVGAGLTGLALAMGLRSRGISPTIVERAHIIAEAGWAITLHERHIDVLQRLGYDPLSWPGGAVDVDDAANVTDLTTSSRVVVMTRSDLQRQMLVPFQDVVRTGVVPVEMSDRGEDVEVVFSDETREVFDVVVGADGLNSWIRQHHLGGPPPVQSGFTVTRMHLPLSLAPDTVAVVRGKAAALGLVPIPSLGVLHAFVIQRRPPLGVGEEVRPSTLTPLFPPTRWELARVLGAMETDPVSHTVDIQQVDTPVWAKGRVAIVGDAAHSMSPALGQGAGVGMEDADQLAALLAEYDVTTALERLGPARQAAAKEVQQASLENADLITSGTPGSIV